MQELFSFERITAQNGWSMAALGIMIDLTGQAQGVYLVTFQTDAGVVHKPFFIGR